MSNSSYPKYPQDGQDNNGEPYIYDKDSLSSGDDSSDDEPMAGTTRVPHQPGFFSQPTPTNIPQPFGFSNQPPPGLGEYMSGTWNAPNIPVTLPALGIPGVGQSQSPPPTQPTVSAVRSTYSVVPNTVRPRPNATVNRPPRNRPGVPASDPYLQVPAYHQFPFRAETVGEGMGSGRNWLVMRDGDSEPVLRCPLRIQRCKKPGRGQATHYPNAFNIIPAGTSLSDVCRYYPMHVWGEMLRIFSTERWDAHRIWDLLPVDARNNCQDRPWNYLQAASGRETDLMFKEETGVKRTIVKRVKSEEVASPAPERTDNIKSEGIDTTMNTITAASDAYLLAGVEQIPERDLSIAQLQASARVFREEGIRLSGLILHARGDNSDARSVQRSWRERHNMLLRRLVVSYEDVTRQPIGTNDPVEIHRLVYELMRPRQHDDPLVSYQARAHWHGWRNYIGALQCLTTEAAQELEDLVASASDHQLEEQDDMEDDQ